MYADTTASYKVTVNRCGVDSTSAPFAVNFKPLPLPLYTYTNIALDYNFTNTTAVKQGKDFYWNFGDSGGWQQSVDAAHTFTAKGIYTVSLAATDKLSQCADTYRQQLIVPTGIDDAGMEKLHMYPNPAATEVAISGVDVKDVRMFDCYGRDMVVTTYCNITAYHIDLSKLSAGVYLLYLNTDDGVLRKRLVVER